jgi:hypothetical protein
MRMAREALRHLPSRTRTRTSKRTTIPLIGRINTLRAR